MSRKDDNAARRKIDRKDNSIFRLVDYNIRPPLGVRAGEVLLIYCFTASLKWMLSPKAETCSPVTLPDTAR